MNTLTNSEIRSSADYQKFEVKNGAVCNVQGRMLQKLEALKNILPDWRGKKVLDIGCDFGFWSFIAAQGGADVLGLDRSREVKNIGYVDIPKLNHETAIENGLNASFAGYEAGVQWWELGGADVVLMLSLYHHVYHNTGGDHEPIWYWLKRHTKGFLIWENPLSADDSVVQMNVHEGFHGNYNEKAIKEAAERYFNIVYEGQALHETTRTVWKLEPKPMNDVKQTGEVFKGAGGASKAFVYGNERRINEIHAILGMRPIPGSMNVFLSDNFEWDRGYYRSALLDVVDRKKGLDSDWAYRPVRYYPVTVNDMKAFAMRFEGEKYPLNMVELISDQKLNIQTEVTVKRWL